MAGDKNNWKEQLRLLRRENEDLKRKNLNLSGENEELRNEQSYHKVKISELMDIVSLKGDDQIHRELLKKTLENAELHSKLDRLHKNLGDATTAVKQLEGQRQANKLMLLELSDIVRTLQSVRVDYNPKSPSSKNNNLVNGTTEISLANVKKKVQTIMVDRSVLVKRCRELEKETQIKDEQIKALESHFHLLNNANLMMASSAQPQEQSNTGSSNNNSNNTQSNSNEESSIANSTSKATTMDDHHDQDNNNDNNNNNNMRMMISRIPTDAEDCISEMGTDDASASSSSSLFHPESPRSHAAAADAAPSSSAPPSPHPTSPRQNNNAPPSPYHPSPKQQQQSPQPTNHNDVNSKKEKQQDFVRHHHHQDPSDETSHTGTTYPASDMSSCDVTSVQIKHLQTFDDDDTQEVVESLKSQIAEANARHEQFKELCGTAFARMGDIEKELQQTKRELKSVTAKRDEYREILKDVLVQYKGLHEEHSFVQDNMHLMEYEMDELRRHKLTHEARAAEVLIEDGVAKDVHELIAMYKKSGEKIAALEWKLETAERVAEEATKKRELAERKLRNAVANHRKLLEEKEETETVLIQAEEELRLAKKEVQRQKEEARHTRRRLTSYLKQSSITVMEAFKVESLRNEIQNIGSKSGSPVEECDPSMDRLFQENERLAFENEELKKICEDMLNEVGAPEVGCMS